MLQFAHFTPRLKWQNANHKTRHSVSLQNKRILVAFTDWSSDRSTGFFSLRLTWPKWHAAHFSSVFDSYLNSYSNSNHCCTVYAGRTDAISWPGKVNWYLIDLTQLTSVITWSTTLPARRPSLGAKTLKRFCACLTYAKGNSWWIIHPARPQSCTWPLQTPLASSIFRLSTLLVCLRLMPR